MTNTLTRYEGQGEVNLPAMMQQGEMVIQSRIFGERFKTPASQPIRVRSNSQPERNKKECNRSRRQPEE